MGPSSIHIVSRILFVNWDRDCVGSEINNFFNCKFKVVPSIFEYLTQVKINWFVRALLIITSNLSRNHSFHCGFLRGIERFNRSIFCSFYRFTNFICQLIVPLSKDESFLVVFPSIFEYTDWFVTSLLTIDNLSRFICSFLRGIERFNGSIFYFKRAEPFFGCFSKYLWVSNSNKTRVKIDWFVYGKFSIDYHR